MKLQAFISHMNDEAHPRLGVRSKIILNLPVWGVDIPHDMSYLWTAGWVVTGSGVLGSGLGGAVGAGSGVPAGFTSAVPGSDVPVD
jgi:hypothetical protein